MDAAVSLHHHHHHHGALPLPASVVPPPHHNHCRTTLPIPLPFVVVSSSSSKPPAARLTTTLITARSTPHAVVPPAAARHYSSSRAGTGYAAALADACVRAGTLHRASRHARAILVRRSSIPEEEEEANARGKKVDARVAALVRMLADKGKVWMVAEVMAEFAAICDHLLLPRA